VSNYAVFSELQIVPATVDMLPDILALEEACFSSPWTRRMLEAEFTNNQFAHFLVARQQGESITRAESTIVGYHCFWIVFEELRLMNLAVRESMRRRGVGGALVTEALRLGLEHAATRAVLEVRASNDPARSLYTRLGFVQISRRPRYYTNPIEDAVLMEMDPLVMSSGQQRDRGVASGGGSASTDSL
jgi:ribosomal-protein-alanine N-acetyltransferase